jgi:uncharacterized protein YydD (DUF2326 family)
MKISKLYCNQPFKNVLFNTEKGKLNVIIGDAHRKSNQKDSHNLGKTRLILLIDFMLLKGVDKKHFFLFTQRKEKGKKLPVYDDNKNIQYVEVESQEAGQLLFQSYEFYLEIQRNDGRYVTIKRSVASPTKISFKIQNIRNQEFILYKDFDYADIALDKAKSLLNDWLDFDFCKSTGENYRRVLNYSLRMQGDYDYQRNSIFQLGKFVTGKHREWKPLVFALLGFDQNLAKSKYELEDFIEKQKEFLKKQERASGIQPQDRDSLIGQIEVKEQSYKQWNKELEVFNFYQQDKTIIKDLVGKIETEIAQLNTQLYGIQYDINKLKQSIKNGFSFDLNRVQDLFEEVKVYFAPQLSKNYEQLVEFNKQITEERNTQIRVTLREKEQEQKYLNDKLLDLHQQKEQYLNLIQDTSLFKKYHTYQKNMFELIQDLSRLKNKLEVLDDAEMQKEVMNQTKGVELGEKIEKLKHIVSDTSKNERYRAIRMSFAEIVHKITFDEAYISIRLNAQNNLEFDCKYSKSAKDEGNTYYKLLCIAFDLALHSYYSRESYFRFIYHDDAFANLDNSRRESLMETIRNITIKHPIQYIFSIIRDDMPNSVLFDWQADEVILTLDDKSDAGKLFYMSY